MWHYNRILLASFATKCHREGKKHMARPGLEPRTSRIPCKHSDHWATEPHGRPMTISPCSIRFVPESARNRRDSPFAARNPSTDPHWATKCHRGGKSTWPNRDSNPGPRASTLTTELPSHMVDLWQLNVTGDEKAPGLEPKTSRIPCEHSDHWATEPHGRPVTTFSCLIDSSPNPLGTMPEPTRQSLCCSQPEHGPTLATKCHRGGKSTWPDRDSNPGPLAYRASTLTTELPSNTVDLWQKRHDFALRKRDVLWTSTHNVMK